jgi:hypothetical protein
MYISFNDVTGHNFFMIMWCVFSFHMNETVSYSVDKSLGDVGRMQYQGVAWHSCVIAVQSDGMRMIFPYVQ